MTTNEPEVPPLPGSREQSPVSRLPTEHLGALAVPSSPAEVTAVAYQTLVNHVVDAIPEACLVEREAFLAGIFGRNPLSGEIKAATEAMRHRPEVDSFRSNRSETMWYIVPHPDEPEAQQLTTLRARLEATLDFVYAQHQAGVIAKEVVLEAARIRHQLSDDPKERALFQELLLKHNRVQLRNKGQLSLIQKSSDRMDTAPPYTNDSLPLQERLRLLYEASSTRLNVVDENWIRVKLIRSVWRFHEAMADSIFASGYVEDYGLWEIVPPGASREPLDNMKDVANTIAGIIAQEQADQPQPPDLFDSRNDLRPELQATYLRELRSLGASVAETRYFLTYLKAHPEMSRLRSEAIERRNAKARTKTDPNRVSEPAAPAPPRVKPTPPPPLHPPAVDDELAQKIRKVPRPPSRQKGNQ